MRSQESGGSLSELTSVGTVSQFVLDDLKTEIVVRGRSPQPWNHKVRRIIVIVVLSYSGGSNNAGSIAIRRLVSSRECMERGSRTGGISCAIGSFIQRKFNRVYCGLLCQSLHIGMVLGPLNIDISTSSLRSECS
jgi:hypothetical protein